jgi:hypothetical protein
MPVRARGRLQVMRQTCSETTGTVGAADVDVESGLEAQAAKPADTNGGIYGRCENEGVSSRFGHQHGLNYTRREPSA